MASRIAFNSLRAAVRPRALSFHVHEPPTSFERASEIIEKLPSSPNLITKTGTALLGVGAAAAAISQELYVVNEETIILIASAIVFTYIGKVLREPYSQWAEGHISRIRNILNDARAEHTGAVKERIDNVAQLKDVVSITQSLFAASKETAKLEAENFVQLQKVTLAGELKAVLDSWVRYEQQVKEREQANLTKSVIDKVLASIKDEKVQKEILQNAVAEVEQLVKSKAI
ncbi:hypothetical protein CPB84DRAFT_1884202 [Gymnopilus junonius]|uniref:ATP synthase subunit 4 n=1 Tax=Gymnopilus junonius TaxID=109634 RepID=A0A9P5NWM8_GYMJU|nr:hypothetical protein CPB84DRAFT_1884202 [Gymnopilus junonius]